MNGKRVALIVRPPAEEMRLAELREAITTLRQEGHRIAVRMTFEKGDARRFARSASLGGCELVVAAGGDGTVNEVVNGLMSADRDTPLGVVPLGTANDFAQGLGLPQEPAAALRVAVAGVRTCVDVAQVNRRCFINVSTGGFGAAATHAASRREKRWLGRLVYLLVGARRLVDFEPIDAEFRVNGDVVYSGPFVFFAVANGTLTGGGTRIAPHADVGDGKLDISVVRGGSRMDFVTLLPDLRAGRHLDSPDVQCFRADTLDVESTESFRVNADGEEIAGSAFRYEMLERPLSVITGV